MRIKLSGLLFSLSLATASLFLVTGCALKSCDMKSDKKASCGAGNRLFIYRCVS